MKAVKAKCKILPKKQTKPHLIQYNTAQRKMKAVHRKDDKNKPKSVFNCVNLVPT